MTSIISENSNNIAIFKAMEEIITKEGGLIHPDAQVIGHQGMLSVELNNELQEKEIIFSIPDGFLVNIYDFTFSLE